LGVLSLVAELAEGRPVLLVVDDAEAGPGVFGRAGVRGAAAARSSDTYLVDSFERRRMAEVRPVPRSEAWAQAVAERVVELVVSALDVNALLDQVDLNAVLDQVDIDRVLDRIDLDRLLGRMDLNDLVKHIDVNALVEQTDLGAIIARSSSGVASDVLDVVRSQTVGLDEFIARWIGRLRRRPYTGPPGPPDRLQSRTGR
jgi:hypothetical protein